MKQESRGYVDKDGDYRQTEVVFNFSWLSRVTRSERYAAYLEV